jgi:PLP dependent protein
MTAIEQRLEQIQSRMDRAAKKNGRAAKDICLIAVTKGCLPDKILEASLAGLTLFAENKLQEAESKALSFPQAEWHMVGHLQTNKAVDAVKLFSCIQSVDSVRIAEKISQEAAKCGKQMRILLEVNVSGESQKYGFDTEGIYTAAEQISALPNLKIEGLMGMAPNAESDELRRPAFKKLKNIFSVLKSVKKPSMEMKWLSMGMSDDFEAAIEEGSNMIRLGRALFK